MKKSVLTFGILMGVNAIAKVAPQREMPRGPEILGQASYCNIGPFPQVSKAGGYNELCTTMTDGEKCLALIKLQMNSVGVVTPVDNDITERAAYCLSHFAEVLGTDPE